MNRRELLKSLAASGGVMMAPGIAWAIPGGRASNQRLVTIFLRGAADGLTICPPLADAEYFDARPTLAVPEADAFALDAVFGLHPAAAGLATLFDLGDLAVVHATGLATAERSHFEAQSVMERGIDAGELPPGDGWMARYLAEVGSDEVLAAVALDRAVPEAMAGAGSALALGSLDSFGLRLDADAEWALRAAYRGDALLAETAEAALAAAERVQPIAEMPIGPGYPDGPLAMALADAARLIRSDSGVVAAALNGGGWDHHDNQAARIGPLLTELGDALVAFREDLGAEWANTTVVVQSEFGRRLRENASAGTDHGHGGVMLVAGGDINGGRIYTDWPGLKTVDLTDSQDLAVTLDYRQVLSEMLSVRLGVDDISSVFPGWNAAPWQGIFRPPTSGATPSSRRPPGATVARAKAGEATRSSVADAANGPLEIPSIGAGTGLRPQ